MSKTSKRLSQISSHIVPFSQFLNKNVDIPASKYSQLSVLFFEKIFDILKDGMTEWHKSNVKYDKLDSIPKGHYFSNIIDSVIEIIDQASIFTTYRCTFHIGYQTYSVYFVYFKRENTEKAIYNQVRVNIEKMYLWLYIANQFSTRSHSSHPHLKIYIYMTDLLKQLPSYPMIIDEAHANTGFTIPCTKTHNREINIFRREEWYKVFIHETFHNLCLDFCDSEQQTKEASVYLLSVIPLNIDLRLYETYCEMWAETMNIAILVFLSIKQPLSFTNWFNHVRKMIEIERQFSVFQCGKMLCYYGLEYSNLYLNDAMSIRRRQKYREKTCVFSYYVLKSILMYYIDDFIIWCMEKNRGSIEFRIHRNIIQSYCHFFKEHFMKTRFIETIENIQYFIMNMTQKKQNSAIMKSLRMTIYG
jgi:hypothetical protein